MTNNIEIDKYLIESLLLLERYKSPPKLPYFIQKNELYTTSI